MQFLSKYKGLIFLVIIFLIFKDIIFSLLSIAKKPAENLSDDIDASAYKVTSSEIKLVKRVFDMIQSQKITDTWHNSDEIIIVNALNEIPNEKLLNLLNEYYYDQTNRVLKTDIRKTLARPEDSREIDMLKPLQKKYFGY
ncbi:MAG: hypothetical protein JNL75_11145 [Chitinophagales bacterium]|nr:hypothetical protein [Chitinophagales bacterium]